MCTPIQYVLTRTAWIGSAIFAQLAAGRPYALQWATRFPLNIAPSHGRAGLASNMWFLWPTRVHNPNGISIGSVVFAGLTSDRQTDHTTASVK